MVSGTGSEQSAGMVSEQEVGRGQARLEQKNKGLHIGKLSLGKTANGETL